MKKLFFSFTIIVFTLFIISCQESTSPVENRADNTSMDKAAPIIYKVTGSGHFTTDAGDYRTFSFNAFMFADGSVKGHYVRTRRVDGVTVSTKGIVTCLEVDGNQAWFAGLDIKNPYDEPPNNGSAWSVVDNGQGKNAPADQISMQWVGITQAVAEGFCLTHQSPDLNDVINGNIQIH